MQVPHYQSNPVPTLCGFSSLHPGTSDEYSQVNLASKGFILQDVRKGFPLEIAASRKTGHF